MIDNERGKIMIDFEWLVVNKKTVSFTWNGKLITGVVRDYIDPDDEEDSPAFISLDGEPGTRVFPSYFIKDITNLKIVD